jgi:hypothetical protein
MQLHLGEIATKVTPGGHAVLILDQAGRLGDKNFKVHTIKCALEIRTPVGEERP